ncbi:MAG: hypothetical protein ACYSWU_01670 [Planctomycetota bacterium]
MGVDLGGGTVLVYQVEYPRGEPPLTPEQLDELAAYLASISMSRRTVWGGSIRRIGDDRLEVIIPRGDDREEFEEEFRSIMKGDDPLRETLELPDIELMPRRLRQLDSS